MKNKLYIPFILFIMCFVTNIVHANLNIQYDNKTEEYNGSVYALSYNGNLLNTDFPPIIINERAMVPVRDVFEAAGAVVTYTEKKEILIKKNNLEVSLKINDTKAMVNNVKVTIPNGLTPKLIGRVGENAKTMVPVRFISESLGMNVEFLKDERLIAISSNDYSGNYVNSNAVISNISYYSVSDKQLQTIISLSAPFGSIKSEVLFNPTRLVVDVPYSVSNNTNYNNINSSGVKSIITKQLTNRTEITITCADIQKYSVVKTTNNQIIIGLLTKDGTDDLVMNYSNQVQNDTVFVKNGNVINSKPVKKTSKIVVLDAGHGGSDSGALGYLEDDENKQIKEKDLTLSITKLVEANLKQAGVSTKLTRTGDTLPSLQERPELANELNASLFVSIHINSAEATSASGIETYYSDENNSDGYGLTSREFAQKLLDNLIKNTDAKNRGVKQAAFAVIRRSTMPASLVELGFISNQEDLQKMCSVDYQKKLAKAISDCIIEVLPKIN